ncbi:hypothetical protein HAX54_030523 [Datura stramonium]|uniref:RING-type domain-containing protein n=1 Tax=Datura stramonium TaxID=4076 RepID=A0ABS8SBB4_DATST|nr:hypothetical protein [Datura stramonium]
MSSRYFITTDSLCNPRTSATEVVSERMDLDVRRTPPSSSFLIRTAIRISRSRCFSFLRRVFHYQNGSRSELGSNPFNSVNWMMMECLALSVQIIVTAYTLAVSKGERPVWPMRIWVFGYAFGCVISLILLYWRYWALYLRQTDDSASNSDIEQQISHDESRALPPRLERCRTWIELFFAIWFVMGNVWVFDSRFGSFHHAPKLHVLCISLLAWNAVTYSFPFILFVLLCCCVPIFSSLLGYNMNMGSVDRGASDEQLSNLPSWKYKEIGNKEDQMIKSSAECCICLTKYKDKEEIRQLPCSHIFHLKCVDQWLKIISCCPLCKQELER